MQVWGLNDKGLQHGLKAQPLREYVFSGNMQA